ncbi:MAG: hemerythrin domain-containing protein [Dehalococcoidales bacterium]|nr:hemerythrin domain-containing protein [Dehalococcoidales bacterium]
MTSHKKPTDILRQEHENVLQKLDALEGVISRLHEKDAIAAQLKDLASFFNTDFWTHFAKEEEALFPELEKFIPRDAGPVGVMLMEHDELRKTNTEIQRAIDEYFTGSDSLQASAVIQNHGNSFIMVLRDHINKENNILFMMADMHLDGSQEATVLKRFDEIENTGGKAK